MDTRRTPEEHGTPEFRYLSPQEINHHMRRAMQMRAEAGAEIFDMAVRGIARLARAGGGAARLAAAAQPGGAGRAPYGGRGTERGVTPATFERP